jgi:hypothetical protein
MWQTFQQACEAMQRDGWRRYTSYLFCKRVSDRTIWVELEWIGGGLVPVQQPDDE